MDVRKDDELEQAPLPGFQTMTSAIGAGFRFSCNGKELLYCGEHYGDMVAPEAASRAADALNAADVQEDWARKIANVK